MTLLNHWFDSNIAYQSKTVMEKTRRDQADQILEHVCDYLRAAGWAIDNHTLFHIDPVTLAKYPTDTAFCIQVGRDFSK